MDRIRYFAEVSVQRAVGFALLAIFTVFIGLSNDWLLACRAGAILLSLLSAVLLHCAWRAYMKDYRRREIWILLDQWHGLPEQRAHHTISAIMRETFLRYAERGAWGAAAMWLVTFSGILIDGLRAGHVLIGVAG